MNTDIIVGSVSSAFSGLLSLIKIPFLIIATWALSVYCLYIQPVFIKPLPPNTFYYKSVLGGIYFRTNDCKEIDCKKLAFFMPLYGADNRSFQILTVPAASGREGYIVESNYAKDAYHIFYKDEIIHTADATTFGAISVDLARDAKQYFLFNKTMKVYFAQTPPSPYHADDGPTEVVAYTPGVFLVLKQNGRYFYAQPAETPADVREISEEESSKYPRLTLAQQ